MRKRESEERFRGAESGNGRTTSERAKLVDAIFSNRRKRSVCVALLSSAFVVGAWAPFEASRVRADETAVATTVNAASVSATTADAFEYRVEGNAATIEGIRAEFRDATTISVPNQIGETLVRKIAPGAFEGLDRLEELHCRAHLTEMGERAFAGCVALKQVRFSAPINTIAREAFAGCGALRFVEHDGIMVLGTGAFRGCAALEKFDVYQIAALEGDAFDGCRSLATFENSATQYRELQALQCVDGLALSRDGRTLIACPGARKGEVVVPDGVVSIASGAFAGGSVETVVLPKTLEVIERNAFANCRALKTVVGAPKTLATIRARAFFFCDALERFEWPENLQTVEEEAFANCRKLESATLKNVRTLGARAFCACSKLAALELSSETREIGAFAFAGTALKSFRLPRELETLGAWALDGIALSAVEIEEGNKALKIVDGAVLSVDGKMLYYRPSLASGTNWKIPEGVRVVVRGALDDNVSLVSLEIPEGVEAIGEGAFSGCASLKKLAIPASVRRIDDRFLGCGALETFEVAEDNPAYRSVDGALLSKDGKTVYRIAREGGSGMTKTRAYWNGREAKRVIPEGVERIAAGAIGDDRLMTSLEIPSTVKRIDADAFGICDRLSSLVIPASVERLDERFEDCDALKDFRVESGNRYYTSVIGALLSKDWRTYYALVGKGDWTRPNTLAPSYVYEATVPKGVQTIEQNAFGGAWQMEKVVLPSTLRTIKRSAFSGATSLKSVTIPAGVDKIEKGAFVGAPLREVVLESSDAKFDKSAFTADLVGPTIRVADETLKRDKAEAEAKKAAEEANETPKKSRKRRSNGKLSRAAARRSPAFATKRRRRSIFRKSLTARRLRRSRIGLSRGFRA